MTLTTAGCTVIFMFLTPPEGVRLAISVAEAAQMLGLSRSKAYELVASGEIPSRKVHGRRLVSTAWCQRWAASIGGDDGTRGARP